MCMCMGRYAGKLGPEVAGHLGRGIDALVCIYNAFKNYPQGSVPAHVAHAFSDAWKMHLHAVHALEIDFKPKHHAMSHLVASMLKFGSPHVRSNWRDEAENKDLARLALRAHRRVWSRRLLLDYRFAYGNKRRRLEQ